MIPGKAAHLSRLYSRVQWKTITYPQHFYGSSPPSVFIGRKDYPNVYAGPLITSFAGNTGEMDSPEQWFPQQKTAGDIIAMRLQLVRGKQQVDARHFADDGKSRRIVTQLQEIALSKHSLEIEAEFRKRPRGRFFHEEMQPFGASGLTERVVAITGRFEPRLEKVHYDTDLLAKDGLVQLYQKGVPFSSIQKAFSTGTMGLQRNRKLVPTRWSITAVDSTLSSFLLNDIRHFPPMEQFRVYEAENIHNRFVILLLPTAWQYESMEAFFPSATGERLGIYSDFERYKRKTEYASIGGCYYSARLAVAEQLWREKKQAGAVIFREAYPEYVPLGVWNVRENARAAMKGNCHSFLSLREAMHYIATRMRIAMPRWVQQSQLLQDALCQRKLHEYMQKLSI